MCSVAKTRLCEYGDMILIRVGVSRGMRIDCVFSVQGKGEVGIGGKQVLRYNNIDEDTVYGQRCS